MSTAPSGSERTPCDGVNDPACVARFWSLVSAPDENGCRRWNAARLMHGEAGKFAGGPAYVSERDGYLRRRQLPAHVFAWALAHGDLPTGVEICHSCDVSDCCETGHMRLGTRADNVRDTIERHVRANGGEGAGPAKLTHREAAEIADLARAQVFSGRAIGAMYGISEAQVRNIKTGKGRAYSVQLGRERAA